LLNCGHAVICNECFENVILATVDEDMGEEPECPVCQNVV